MTIHEYFPTLVYTAALQRSGAREFNRRLLQECRQLREDDAAGRRWSRRELSGRLHLLRIGSPAAAHLADIRRRCERKLAAARAGVCRRRRVGSRGPRAVDDGLLGQHHAAAARCTVLHLHPLSTLSGTYYVHVPSGIARDQVRGSAAGSLHGGAARARRTRGREPRLDHACPPRPGIWCCSRAGCGTRWRPTPWTRERVSVSFNYNWF